MFAGKKSAQIREILISESAWEEMTCLFAPSLVYQLIPYQAFQTQQGNHDKNLQQFPEALNYRLLKLRLYWPRRISSKQK